MAFSRASFGTVLLFVGCCLGQDRVGTDPKVAIPLIQHVLSAAQVSGSLAYSGACDFHNLPQDFPKLRPISHSGKPVEVLRQMFADDPRMRVTQERDGKIRMIETNAPQDLLNVKIRHLTFQAGVMSHGPRMALRAILMTPEVIAFRREHSIGPLAEFTGGGFSVPGDCCSGRSVMGELDDVTVAQALDYVLQTFPGFWLYETCQDPTGERMAIFKFYANAVLSSVPTQTQR